MDTFYLVLVIILFLLAISDLVVGVSNDAVNFLNSAVGSRAGSFRTILVVAAFGIIVGATFSSGMMEVARKGIFNPEYFLFSEIMIIFLAVMVTDVILLDTFNTYGMPTSTTVSLVFELLGASVAMAAIKVYTDQNALQLHEYINNEKALVIILGILLSVVLAFTFGAVVQYVTRLIFSFDYTQRLRTIGPLFGGLGVTVITHFMIIKGITGSTFYSPEVAAFIDNNTLQILIYSFIGWSLILFLINRIFNINIFKTLVLIGTFALAMAFAGNDLVNFIGVPLAAFSSYEIFRSGSISANDLLMSELAGEVPTPTLLLVLAGIIMAITLFLSKKAHSVLKTSLDLGRQDEGYERFSSYMLSRSLVRNVTSIGEFVNKSIPGRVQNVLKKQFDETPFKQKQKALKKEAPVFDLLRASVTLVVSSILITIGTNYKLPLSTTYITFMVFMGASLADGAWGRESAVYRVSGVLSVIGGWFFTAFSAFTVAFILLIIFHFGGILGIVAVLLLAGFAAFRTHKTHSKRVAELAELEKRYEEGGLDQVRILEMCKNYIQTFSEKFDEAVSKSLKALGKDDRSALNDARNLFKPTRKRIEWLQLQSSKILDDLPEHELESGHIYIIVIDYLREMALQADSILKSNFKHVDNNHKPLTADQIQELEEVLDMVRTIFNNIIEAFQSMNLDKLGEYNTEFREYASKIRDIRKIQINRIKKRKVGTRNSILYLQLLSDFRNMMLFANRIVRVLEDLVQSQEENNGTTNNLDNPSITSRLPENL